MRRLLLPSLLVAAPLLLNAQPARQGPGQGQNRAPEPPPPQLVAPPLTPEQTATIMKQIEMLETTVGKGRVDLLGAALKKFREANSNPKEAVRLWLECFKLEEYERKNLPVADFLAWKDGNSPDAQKLQDERFVNGIGLQLEYLILTIQAQDITEQKDMGPIVTALQAFIPKLVKIVDESVKHTGTGAVEIEGTPQKDGQGRRPINGGDGERPGGKGARRAATAASGGGTGNLGRAAGELGQVLNEQVNSSLFCRAYLIENLLKRAEWSYSPIDVPRIYETVIFPYYLATKPEELPAQWDHRINAELALRKIVMSETEFGLEYKERHPALLWQKATFMLERNLNPLQAVADMLKVVRENPNHSNATIWLQQIRSLVTQGQQQAPSPGTPTPAVTTPAATPAAAATTTVR
jgi:hypothetical protein